MTARPASLPCEAPGPCPLTRPPRSRDLTPSLHRGHSHSATLVTPTAPPPPPPAARLCPLTRNRAARFHALRSILSLPVGPAPLLPHATRGLASPSSAAPPTGPARLRPHAVPAVIAPACPALRRFYLYATRRDRTARPPALRSTRSLPVGPAPPLPHATEGSRPARLLPRRRTTLVPSRLRQLYARFTPRSRPQRHPGHAHRPAPARLGHAHTQPRGSHPRPAKHPAPALWPGPAPPARTGSPSTTSPAPCPRLRLTSAHTQQRGSHPCPAQHMAPAHRAGPCPSPRTEGSRLACLSPRRRAALASTLPPPPTHPPAALLDSAHTQPRGSHPRPAKHPASARWPGPAPTARDLKGPPHHLPHASPTCGTRLRHLARLAGDPPTLTHLLTPTPRTAPPTPDVYPTWSHLASPKTVTSRLADPSPPPRGGRPPFRHEHLAARGGAPPPAGPARRGRAPSRGLTRPGPPPPPASSDANFTAGSLPAHELLLSRAVALASDDKPVPSRLTPDFHAPLQDFRAPLQAEERQPRCPAWPCHTADPCTTSPKQSCSPSCHCSVLNETKAGNGPHIRDVVNMALDGRADPRPTSCPAGPSGPPPGPRGSRRCRPPLPGPAPALPSPALPAVASDSDAGKPDHPASTTRTAPPRVNDQDISSSSSRLPCLTPS